MAPCVHTCNRLFQLRTVAAELMTLTGCPFRRLSCNCGCVECPQVSEYPSDGQHGGVIYAKSKEQIRSLMADRPTEHTCLLINSRLLTGMHKWLRGCQVVYKYTPGSETARLLAGEGEAVRGVSVFTVPLDPRGVGRCGALERGEHNLEMVFKGQTKDGRELRVLFDSGATHSFVGEKVWKGAGGSLSPGEIRSVATANDRSVAVKGKVTLSLRLGPVCVEVGAHVMPELLSSVDMIIGQDFMQASHAVLDYGVGRCILRRTKRVVLGHQPAKGSGEPMEWETPQDESAGQSDTSRMPPEQTEYKGTPACCMATPAEVASMLRRGCEAFVAVVKPQEPAPRAPI